MTDTMTLEQVRDWLNNCAISNTPSSDISNEFLGELADAIDAAIKQREQGAKDAALLKWAVSRWNAEVLHRPLVNVHRRTLDDTWRQVIRHAGGDDVVILGPRHDDLVAMAKESGNG